MIDFEDIGKVVAVILLLGGFAGIVFGVMSLLSSTPNPMLLVAGILAAGIGIAIGKAL